MSEVNGKMRICDCCGAWVFLKCTGERDLDGGFTHLNTFEPAPGWNFISNVGSVCPECWKDYCDMLERFKKRPLKVKKEEVQHAEERSDP